MSSDLPSPGMAPLDDETAVLEMGSRASGTEMFYWLPELAPNRGDGASWSQSIPGEMGLTEAEYYALIKGLGVAIEREYSMVDVATNSPSIVDQLRDGESPSNEVSPFYETAVRLVDQFDAVRISAYAVDM
jgi:hypothetical protein